MDAWNAAVQAKSPGRAGLVMNFRHADDSGERRKICNYDAPEITCERPDAVIGPIPVSHNSCAMAERLTALQSYA